MKSALLRLMRRWSVLVVLGLTGITGVRLWFYPPGWLTGSRIEVEMKVDDSGYAWQNRAHLYFDRGEGFNETESRRTPLPGKERFEVVRFHLPYGSWESLRFDPMARPGEVSVREVRLISNREERVWAGEALAGILQPRENVRVLDLDDESVVTVRSLGEDPSFDLLIEPLPYGGPLPREVVAILASLVLLGASLLFFFECAGFLFRCWKRSSDGFLSSVQKGSVLAAVSVTIGSYLLFARQVEPDPVPQHLAGYNLYYHLTEAFLHGQLHLLEEPVRELREMENPFDPVGNRSLRLHDASYYEGRYYVYFGPAPVLSVYLPWRILTGCDLPDRWAGAFFLSGAFIMLVLLFLRVQRACLSGGKVSFLMGSVLALGFSTGVLDLMACSIVYQVALGSAFFWTALALLAAVEWSMGQQRNRYLGLAGFSMGMAMASRHSFVLFGLVFFGWMLLWWVAERPPFKDLLRRCLALGTPTFLIGVTLLLHNFVRFGDITEFGHNHQIGLVDPNAVQFLDLDNLSYNTVLNLFQPPGFQATFPFVQITEQKLLDWVPPSQSHYGVESALGLLVANPFLLILPFLVFPEFSRRGVIDSVRRKILWLIGLLGTLAIVQFIIIASFSFSVFRYSLDYLPWMVLCFVVGWGMAESRGDGPGRIHRAVIALGLTWSLFLHFGVALDRAL